MHIEFFMQYLRFLAHFRANSVTFCGTFVESERGRPRRRDPDFPRLGRFLFDRQEGVCYDGWDESPRIAGRLRTTMGRRGYA